MIETHQERPRELKWYHAGPMLYGDWGTSRFYVLGLAFFYTLHASFWYVVGVGILVAAVGWAYTIICRCYPDGGGVYSAARHTSKQLAVIGALLLFADYIVTAAMSAFDGMHYLGLHGRVHVEIGAIIAVLFIGCINYIGPRKAGTFALIVAMATLVLTAVIVIFTIPHLPLGWHRITPLAKLPGTPRQKWENLVAVVLALSGVEAIANMTGIMVPPVAKTSKKAIIPVLLEVVILNIVLAIGMNALTPIKNNPKSNFTIPAATIRANVAAYKQAHPTWASSPVLRAKVAGMDQAKVREDKIENEVLRVMASDYVGHPFAVVCGVVFGLLLISAVNTAVADMVSIQYVMSRDAELPRFLTKLNTFGVPWIGLLAAIGVPAILLMIFHDLDTLGDLYAIGVVGAITINLGSCCYNRQMPLKLYERIGMGIIAVVMGCIELTLAVEKHAALIFASTVLISGLTGRFFTKTYPKLSATARAASLSAVSLVLLAIGITLFKMSPVVGQHHHIIGMLMLVLAVALALAGLGGIYLTFRVATGGATLAGAGVGGALSVPTAQPKPSGQTQIDMSLPRVMVATRGNPRLLEFAANYAKQINGLLFVIFVRPLQVSFVAGTHGPTLAEDSAARDTIQMARDAAQKANVPLIPIYAVSPDVATTILDFAATYNVSALLMGVSRRTTMLRALQGDTLTAVADQLPPDIPLLIHA